LKYKVTPTIEVGTFYAHGRTNNGSSITAGTSSVSTGLAGLGVGFQATPALLLGANYVSTSFNAKMTNLQAHYALSKRTRVYSQMTFTQSSSNTIQQSTSGSLAKGFTPVNCGSSSTQAAYAPNASTGNTTNYSNTCDSALPGSAGNQNYPAGSGAGYTLGVIHSF